MLNVITRSPTDAQPVFDAIVQSAARLCEAIFSVVWLYDGELLQVAATHNFTPEVLNKLFKTYPARPDRSTAAGRAVLDGKIAHLPDPLADARTWILADRLASDADLDTVDQNIATEIDRAVAWAEEAPLASPIKLPDDVYASH